MANFEIKNKKDLTKDFLIKFFSEKSAEEKAWFKQLCLNHKKQITNNLTGKDAESYDWKVIREEVCIKYFYDKSELSKKEKSKKKTKKDDFESFLDEI